MSTVDSLLESSSDQINNKYETKSINTISNTIISNNKSIESTPLYDNMGIRIGYFKLDVNGDSNHDHLPTSMNDLSTGYDNNNNIDCENNRNINKLDFCNSSISSYFSIERYNNNSLNYNYNSNRDIQSNKKQKILTEVTLHYYNCRNDIENAISNVNFDYLHEVKDINEYDPIHLAVLTRKSAIINYLVNDRNCDINKQDINNETPLMIAVKEGNIDLVINIIEDYNCNLSIKNNGKSVLHYSAIFNKLNILKYFIDKKFFDIYDKDNDGNNILHLAYVYRHYNDIIRYLLKIKYETSITNKDKKTAVLINIVGSAAVSQNIDLYRVYELVDAVANNQEDRVNDLLAKYKYVIYDIYDKYQRNLLVLAHDKRYVNIANVLRCYPIDFDLISEESKVNAIRWFSVTGDFNYFKETIKYDFAVLKSTDKYNKLPIHYAIQFGHYDIFKYIVDIDNNMINKSDEDNLLPVHYASQYGYYEIFKYIVDIDNNMINMFDKGYQLPVHYACEYGNYDIFKYILDIDKNMINKPNLYNQLPVHYASKHGHYNIFIDIVDIDKNLINKTDKCNQSPLILATINNQVQIIKHILTFNHIGKSHKDKYGKSAVDYAKEKNNIKIIDLLNSC